MYILVKNNLVSSVRTKVYQIPDSRLVHSFGLNNLCKNEIDKLGQLKKVNELTDIFFDSSFLIEDKISKKVIFYRDWPGNNQAFYFYDQVNKIFFMSDTINEIAENVDDIKLSTHGTKLFLNERKHFILSPYMKTFSVTSRA